MWKMKEDEEAPGPRNCSSANGKSLLGSEWGSGDVEATTVPAEYPFPEARKPKFSVWHFWWLCWLWATAYLRITDEYRVTLTIATHPRFQLKVKGLKIILNKKEAHLVLAAYLKAVSLRCDSLQPILSFVLVETFKKTFKKFELKLNGSGRERQWGESWRRRKDTQQRTRFLYAVRRNKLQESDCCWLLCWFRWLHSHEGKFLSHVFLWDLC